MIATSAARPSPASLRPSLGLATILILSAALSLSQASQARGANDGPAGAIAAYRGHRKALSSLLVQYHAKVEPLVDEEALFKYLRQMNNPESDSVVVIKGPRIYLRTTSKIRDVDGFLNRLAKERGKPPGPDELTFAQIKKGTDGLPPKTVENFLMFDGDVLWERTANAVAREGEGGEHHGYFASKVTKGSARQFPVTYLDYIGYGLDDPCLADQGRDAQRDRLPEIMEVTPFTIKGEREMVDGAACLLLESPGFQRLWLDPKLGYAARRREVLDGDQPLMDVQASDFAEVVSDVWMPRRVIARTMGWGRMPAEYLGKPLSQLAMQVERFQANDPKLDDYFIPKPPPGSYVVNKTIAPLDADMKPMGKTSDTGIMYIQPADSARLDEVVENARIRAGMRLEDVASAGRRRWVVLGSIIVLSAAVVTMFFLRRPHPSAKPEG